MAYQNVGTPRFYIDIPTYLNSIGKDYGEEFDKSLFTLNPITPVKLFDQEIGGTQTLNIYNEFNELCNPNKFYFAMLNHNINFLNNLNDDGTLGEGNSSFFITGLTTASQVTEEVLNYNDSFIQGSTILTGDIDEDWSYLNFADINMVADAYAGSISFGSYYDMPHSPDLKLTMEVEMDGYNSFQTAGGSTLTNVTYNGSPYWNDKDGNKSEPFSVGASTGVSKRNGRRNWSMKFSHVTDSNLFASNYMSNNHLETTTDYDGDDLASDVDGNSNAAFEYTLNNDDSFIAQVLNKVGNGQRFIFQPDNTNNNPDQFAICMLDQDLFSIKQVAYKVYDISLKIREVW